MSGRATAEALDLAQHYVSIEQHERALAVLERAEQDFDDAGFWRLRTLALLGLGRDDEARRAALAGLERCADEPWLHYLLAFTLERLGDLAGGERAILQALRHDPEEPSFLCQYADLAARAGQLDKARRLVDEAARADPESSAVARMRYVLATLDGSDAEASREAREWVERDPENPHSLAAHGLQLVGRGDAGRGYRQMQSAVSLDPRVAEGLTESFTESRLHAHWTMWPLQPVHRFGPAKVWIFALALILGLQAAGQPIVAGIFGVIYLVYCVYSWVAPPLLRRSLARGGR